MTSSANSSGSLQLPRRSSTVGANAIAQWLHDNGLEPELDGWNATIVLSAVLRDVPAHETSETTRFEIELEPERWTLCFRHGGLVSRIRVAELATVVRQSSAAVAEQAIRRFAPCWRGLPGMLGVRLLTFAWAD